jgi:hypothetical protein
VRVSVEREHGGAVLLDVLDRLLDKGIVITRALPLESIDLSDEDVRVIVWSLDTYWKHSEASSFAPELSPEPVLAPEGGEDSGTGSGGAPSFVGTAHVLPRLPPSRHRRPID